MVGLRFTAADLSAQLETAHRVIAQERRLRKKAEEDLVQVAAHARELHWKLKPEHDEMLRERREKVRTLRPVPDAEDHE